MSNQIKHQEDLYGQAQRIRCHEIMLQVMAGESSNVIEKVRTVTGLTGGGDYNDMVSLRMALELGLIIRECDHEQLLVGTDNIPLRVVGMSKLKIRRQGPFGAGIPHWTDIEVYVMIALQGLLQKDMLLSWPTQSRLRLLNNNNENSDSSDGLLRY